MKNIILFLMLLVSISEWKLSAQQSSSIQSYKNTIELFEPFYLKVISTTPTLTYVAKLQNIVLKTTKDSQDRYFILDSLRTSWNDQQSTTNELLVLCNRTSDDHSYIFDTPGTYQLQLIYFGTSSNILTLNVLDSPLAHLPPESSLYSQLRSESFILAFYQPLLYFNSPLRFIHPPQMVSLFDEILAQYPNSGLARYLRVLRFLHQFRLTYYDPNPYPAPHFLVLAQQLQDLLNAYNSDDLLSKQVRLERALSYFRAGQRELANELISSLVLEGGQVATEAQVMLTHFGQLLEEERRVNRPPDVELKADSSCFAILQFEPDYFTVAVDRPSHIIKKNSFQNLGNYYTYSGPAEGILFHLLGKSSYVMMHNQYIPLRIYTYGLDGDIWVKLFNRKPHLAWEEAKKHWWMEVSATNALFLTFTEPTPPVSYENFFGVINLKPKGNPKKRFVLATPQGIIDIDTLANSGSSFSYEGSASGLQFTPRNRGKSVGLESSLVDLVTTERTISTGNFQVQLFNKKAGLGWEESKRHWWLVISGSPVCIYPVPLVASDSGCSIQGTISIKPVKGVKNRFRVVTPAGIVDRDDLELGGSSYSYNGEASVVQCKVRGEGNSLIVNGSPFTLSSGELYTWRGALQVQLWNTSDPGTPWENAKNKWKIQLTGMDIQFQSCPLSDEEEDLNDSDDDEDDAED
jgi:hypothetical protein